MVNRIRMGATTVVLIVFVIAAYVSLQGIHSPTYWFPAFISVSGTLVAAFNLLADGRKLRAGQSLTEGEVTDIGASLDDMHTDDDGDQQSYDGAGVRRRVITWSAWLVALPVLGLFIPFFYAALIWVFAVLKFQARKRWVFVLPAVASFGVVMNVIIVLLAIKMPPAILTGLG